MKIIKKLGFIFCILFNFLSFGPTTDPLASMSPEELKKFEAEFEKLGNLSEEELFNKITEELKDIPEDELMKMTNELLNALPEDEKKKVLEETSKLTGVSYEEVQKLLEEKPKEEIKQPEQEKVIEEPKLEKKEVEEKVPYTSKTEEVKNLLNKILSKITDIRCKLNSLPQISNKIFGKLCFLESLLKRMVIKNNLLNILGSNEFVLLKNNLSAFEKELANKLKFSVPDTAGLKITFDEECEDEEFTLSQEKMKELISFLEKNIIDKKILKDLEDLFQKYVPKELKEIKAEQKEEELPELVSNKAQKVLTIEPRQKNSSSLKYNPSNFPTSSSSSIIPALVPSNVEKKDEKSEVEAKEEKKKSPSKRNFPLISNNSAIDNDLKNLKVNYETISNDLDSTLNKLNDKSKKSNLNSINLESLLHHDNAINTAQNINTSIKKLSQETQEIYKNKLKEFYNPLDKKYLELEKITVALTDNDKELKNFLIQIVEKGKKLKKLTESKE